MSRLPARGMWSFRRTQRSLPRSQDSARERSTIGSWRHRWMASLVDLDTALYDAASIEPVGASSGPGRDVLRHSTAHVMAQAVTRLWPGAHFAIGPVIEGGFYYDFELPGGAHFTDEDLARIDAEMRAIIRENQPFHREEHDEASGLRLFADQPFKVEIIETVAAESSTSDVDAVEPDLSVEAGDGTVVSAYRNTEEFVDLCKGPHVPSTGYLGHFKLQRVAGAYWRGDEHRQQLQRIYGTAWESDKALAEHLARLEEAERRDHRRLGAELDLFSFPPEIGSGLAVFHPKGGIIRREMEDYSRRRHDEAGYLFVNTPHVAKSDLFETSGHLEWYADGMYPPMELDEGHRYYVKPMNCPFHVLIYRSRQRSYRELPMRLFEFGSVYRYEKSGVVHGLSRVRGMTQDDAHIFCASDQMVAELESLLGFVLDLLRDYGLTDFYLELSTRPEEKSVGRDEEWDAATDALRQAAGAMNLDLVMDEGGGAFYGPKISVQARDAIGRYWQVSTIQLDFQTPQRFGLEYVGRDNAATCSGDDPPGPVRVGRTVLRDSARTLRGRDADMALARSGGGAASDGGVSPVRRVRGISVPRGRPARRARRSGGQDRQADQAEEDREDPLHPRGGRRGRGVGDCGRQPQGLI